MPAIYEEVKNDRLWRGQLQVSAYPIAQKDAFDFLATTWQNKHDSLTASFLANWNNCLNAAIENKDSEAQMIWLAILPDSVAQGVQMTNRLWEIYNDKHKAVGVRLYALTLIDLDNVDGKILRNMHAKLIDEGITELEREMLFYCLKAKNELNGTDFKGMRANHWHIDMMIQMFQEELKRGLMSRESLDWYLNTIESMRGTAVNHFLEYLGTKTDGMINFNKQLKVLLKERLSKWEKQEEMGERKVLFEAINSRLEKAK